MTRILLAFVLGVALLQRMADLPHVWHLLVGGLVLLMVFVLGRRMVWRALQWVSVYGGCLLLGLLWATLRAEWRLAEALPLAWEQKSILIEGVVAELPNPLERGVRFAFDVERVLTPDAMVPSHIVLSEYADMKRAETGFESRYHAGQRWQLLVKLKRPHAQLNPHGFDMEAWSLERNIRAVGRVEIKQAPQLLTAQVWQPRYVIEMLRERIAQRMQHVLGARPYAAILMALAIGQDDAIARDDWLVFLRTGITHLISISGLHITMLSGMVTWGVYQSWRRFPRLLQRCPARKVAVLAGLVTALSYSLIAGFSIPTQRTLYMLALFALALWFDRPMPMRKIMAWALFLVCLLDPWATLSPGFWLSFGAVFVMVFALSGRLERASWWQEALQTQWVVTLGLIPLLLYLFGQFSIISPLANALAIPLISLVVTPLTLLGALLPIDSALWLAHEAMAWGMRVLIWMAAQPWAVWQQHAPLPSALILAMIAMVWMFLPKGLPFRRLVAMALLPMALLQAPSIEAGHARATILDIGQGLSVLIKTQHHQLLYDTGPNYSTQSDAGSRIVLPFLQSEGIKKLDGLVISHDDNDHSGGMESVLAGVSVDWVLTSLSKQDARLVQQQVVACHAGQSWQWDGVRFTVLYPFADSARSTLKDNDKSCVLKVETQGASLLIPGDIERRAEHAMVEHPPEWLASDVLVAPHHGSKTSSTIPFLEQVNPNHVVFTVGYLNRHHHPHPKVVDRYAQRNTQLYRTDLNGAVTVDLTPRNVQLEKYRLTHPKYWYGR